MVSWKFSSIFRKFPHEFPVGSSLRTVSCKTPGNELWSPSIRRPIPIAVYKPPTLWSTSVQIFISEFGTFHGLLSLARAISLIADEAGSYLKQRKRWLAENFYWHYFRLFWSYLRPITEKSCHPSDILSPLFFLLLLSLAFNNTIKIKANDEQFYTEIDLKKHQFEQKLDKGTKIIKKN